MEITGKIKVIEETKQVSETFRKRDLVVTTAEEYPQHITIQFVKDKCEVLSSYKVGQEVTVSVNLLGREYTKDGVTRYFNTIQGWKIEKAQSNVESINDDFPY